MVSLYLIHSDQLIKYDHIHLISIFLVVLHEEPGVCVQEYPDPLVEHPVQLRALKDNEYPATETNLLHLLEQEGKQ